VSIQELEAEALKLSPAEREELVRRLLSNLIEEEAVDPLLGLGSEPVVCGISDGSARHDAYVNEAAD
jgi:hypothetical protein